MKVLTSLLKQFFEAIISSERFLRSRSNGPPILNGDGSSSGPTKETPLFSSDTSRQAYREQVNNDFIKIFYSFLCCLKRLTP